MRKKKNSLFEAQNTNMKIGIYPIKHESPIDLVAINKISFSEEQFSGFQGMSVFTEIIDLLYNITFFFII